MTGASDHLQAAGEAGDAPVAIVGISCRLPRAADPEAFWQLLRDGVDAVSRVPAGRWADDTGSPNGAGSPDGVDVRRGAFLDRVDGFDADFFGISPREAAGMDPQQRLVLELAWEALEDAGIIPAAPREQRAGGVGGGIRDDYATPPPGFRP